MLDTIRKNLLKYYVKNKTNTLYKVIKNPKVKIFKLQVLFMMIEKDYYNILKILLEQMYQFFRKQIIVNYLSTPPKLKATQKY